MQMRLPRNDNGFGNIVSTTSVAIWEVHPLLIACCSFFHTLLTLHLDPRLEGQIAGCGEIRSTSNLDTYEPYIPVSPTSLIIHSPGGIRGNRLMGNIGHRGQILGLPILLIIVEFRLERLGRSAPLLYEGQLWLRKMNIVLQFLSSTDECSALVSSSTVSCCDAV